MLGEKCGYGWSVALKATASLDETACSFSVYGHGDTACASIFISYLTALICLEYLLDRETLFESAVSVTYC